MTTTLTIPSQVHDILYKCIVHDIHQTFFWMYKDQKPSSYFSDTAARFNVSPDDIVECGFNEPYEVFESIDMKSYVDTLKKLASTIHYCVDEEDEISFYIGMANMMADVINTTYISELVDENVDSNIVKIADRRQWDNPNEFIYNGKVSRHIVTMHELGTSWCSSYAYDRWKDTASLLESERQQRIMEVDLAFLQDTDELEPEYIGRSRR